MVFFRISILSCVLKNWTFLLNEKKKPKNTKLFLSKFPMKVKISCLSQLQFQVGVLE